eukprot:1392818-Amorphochlora_amoeboformis.AAC.3
MGECVGRGFGSPEITGHGSYLTLALHDHQVPDGGPMDSIRELHKTIQETIMEMQGRTIQVLKNQHEYTYTNETEREVRNGRGRRVED